MAFAVIAVAAGLFGVNSVGAFDAQPELTDMQALAVVSAFSGHVTAIHSDAAGNIIAYMQTDNVVTDEGTDCASEILFAKAALTPNNCPIVWVGGTAEDITFDAIRLYASGTPLVGTTAATPIVTLVAATAGLDAGLNATITGNSAASSSPTITTLAKTFTAGGGVSGAAVLGAMLVLDEDGTGTAVFAATEFSAGAVSMDDSDTLAVTWTMSLT